MSSVFDSVQSGRFFVWFEQALKRFNVTDQEYLEHILPHIHEAHLWNTEIAEKEIRLYRERRSNAAKS
jgi:hypothetical protein